MRKIKKTFTKRTKIVSFSLALLLAVSIMTAVLGNCKDVMKAEAAGNMTLAQLQQKFPHGKYWNHMGGSNNPDGYTSTPCSSHKNCGVYANNCSCNSFLNAIQCHGFVMKLAYDYYGSSLRNWNRSENKSYLNSVKAGDAIRYKGTNPGHTIWITAVSGDTFTYADCNSNGKCVIRWNQKIKKSEITGFQYVRIAPYELSGAGTAAPELVAPTVTTSYKYYASNAKVTVNWNAVSGAIDYRFVIWKNGEQIFSEPVGNITSYSIDTASKGNYEIYVIATNGIDYKTSECCQFYVGYLDKPEISTSSHYYAENASVRINWSECEGATKYWLHIWENGENIYNDPVGMQTHYDISNANGTYEIMVESINDNGGWQVEKSDYYVFYAGNMRAPIIDTSVRYYAENGNVTIRWNACEGATNYYVHFWKDYEDYFGEYTDGATYYTFSNAPSGYYSVYVSAVNASGGYQWETSEVYNFYVEKLNAPTVSTSKKYYASNAKVNVNWNAVPEAIDYRFVIWKDGEQIFSEPVGNITSYLIDTASEGNYEIYVIVTNGIDYKTSQCCQFYVGKLEQPVVTTAKKYYAKGSKVTVNLNACEGATKYFISAWVPDEQIVSEFVSGTSYTIDTEESKYGVFVYAVNDNGGYQENGSEKLNFWATDFSLDKTYETLRVGSELQLNAVVGAMDENDSIVWRSSDASVAGVSSAGLVGAFKPGTVIITAQLGNLISSCTVTVTNPATAIALSKTSLSLKKGENATLTATVTPNDSSDSVVWTSSNTAVATVSNGVVTAVNKGSATITAKAGSKSATCTVTVTNPATAISLSKTSLSLKKGENATLTATVTPNDSTDSVVWTSSNTAVVTVSNGVVTAVNKGSATITAKAGSKSTTCSVTVTNPATAITLSKTSLSLKKGENATLTATVTPNDSSDSVVWTSSNTAVATVSNGVVTAVNKGSATITAKAGSKSATCTVTVTNPATAISLSKTSLSLKKGENATLTATVTPNDSTDSVVWTSSNTAVATVSNGVVTAVNKGSATITAKAGSKSATCSVTVTNPATAITLSKTSLSLKKGENATLTATVTPNDSTDSVVWTSSNTAVATVSNGTVTAVGNGSATITAKAGSKSATCTVTVTETTPTAYDVSPNINGGASKLYEPWGLRYYAVFNGADIDKISDRGIAILKETFYASGMTPAQFCANENANVFLGSRNELAFDEPTSANPNGRYFATLTKGIYSYDIGAKYYVVPFAVMNNGQTIYGTIKSNSMENILKANLNLPTITQTEKAICTCILELKKSVAAHYAAVGVPGASVDMNIPRGSSQSAANVTSTTAAGVTPNVVGGASRLIEPWGLRYFATYTESANIAERGMVILSEKYYQSSYSNSPDQMRRNANSYVFRDSDGTLLKQSETNRYYGTVTEGISSKDIADVYYVVPFAVLNDGSYVYGTVKSNSMMKIMRANLNSPSVPATERAVSEDIIDLYNAVKAYYDGQ